MVLFAMGTYDQCVHNESSFPGDYDPTMTQVTADMVRSRTVELALSAGRSALEIRQLDYERAKRELTGEKDFDRQLAMLYSGP
jgi:hypothetical protein